MAVQTAVEVLARILDGYGSEGRSVRHVGAATIAGGRGTIEAELEVPVPLCGGGRSDTGETPVGATLTDEGTVSVEFPTDRLTEIPSVPDAEVTASPRTARICDGQVLVTVEATIRPVDGDGRSQSLDDGPGRDGTQPRERDGTRTGVDGEVDHDDAVRTAEAEGDEGSGPDARQDTAGRLEAIRNEAVPPYEDVEYLRAIYERFDTFAEMRAAIEMDVSTETVRRYMIDAGIHDPTSYGTSIDTAGSTPGERDAGDGDPNEPSAALEATDPAAPIPDEQLVTDGIGLPEHLDLEDVLAAVVESSTVYEVTRNLRLDQRRTREILEQLDLLSLVMHRVSDDRNREVTYEEVAERLRKRVDAG